MALTPEEKRPLEPEQRVATRWHERHVLRSFESEIREQEDLLFGVSLYFEAIQFLHAGQEAVLETHRKELRNILQLGRQSVEQASTLLEAARNDPSKSRELQDFRFHACQGSACPEELKQRALILFQTYQEIFQRRARTSPLTEDEIVRLVNRAAEKMSR